MSDKLVEYQKAFLLLQLLAADQRQLSQGAANQALKGPARKLLALDPTTANRLRDALAVEGYLERTRVGRAVAYKLTARGVGLLLRLEQYPSGTLVPGRWINELLRAARDTSAARPPAAPVDSTPLLREAQARFDNLQRQLRELFTETCHRLAGEAGPPAAPLQAPDLLGAILAEFDALLRERYSHQRRVPVYELRRNLARKLGPAAASHDRFDPAVKLLRQQNRIRLVPISDLRDATADQLNDSVPGINETFFYLEPVHEPVAPR